MAKDALSQREQALEDEFFNRVGHGLHDELRKTIEDRPIAAALVQTTGFDEELVEGGFSSESLAALALTPLVLVAWAARAVDESERRAVVHVAMTKQIGGKSLAFQLVNQWLDSEPPPELFVTWRHYTKAVCKTLTTDTRESLRNEIMKHATEVARTSGNVLGYGRISRAEQSMLDNIEQSFEA